MKEEAKEKKEGIIIPKEARAPFSPGNLFLKKSDFIAKERKRKEDAAKVAAYAKKLAEGGEETETVKAPAPAVEVEKVAKPGKAEKKKKNLPVMPKR